MGKKLKHPNMKGGKLWSGHAAKGHPVYGIKKTTKKEAEALEVGVVPLSMDDITFGQLKEFQDQLFAEKQKLEADKAAELEALMEQESSLWA